MDFWAFSLMELGHPVHHDPLGHSIWSLLPYKRRSLTSEPETPNSELRIPNSTTPISDLILLALFLCLILFQMIPLPSGVVKVLSPKNYELRNFLVPDLPLHLHF